jgi:hypothetical protein
VGEEARMRAVTEPRQTDWRAPWASLLVPGLGQFLQRRFVAGCLFAGLFLTAAGWLLIEALITLVAVYRWALAAATADEPHLRLPCVAAALALCLALSVASVLDGWRAARSRRPVTGQ